MNHYETCGICHTTGPCRHYGTAIAVVPEPPTLADDGPCRHGSEVCEPCAYNRGYRDGWSTRRPGANDAPTLSSPPTLAEIAKPPCSKCGHCYEDHAPTTPSAEWAWWCESSGCECDAFYWPALTDRIAAPGFDAEVDRAREILDAKDAGWNEGVEAAALAVDEVEAGSDDYLNPLVEAAKAIRSLLIPTVPPTEEET